MPKPDYLKNVREAMAFRDSPRGQYLIAQALVIATTELLRVQGAMREVSNITDMQFMLDTLYPGLSKVIKQEYQHLEAVKEKVNGYESRG